MMIKYLLLLLSLFVSFIVSWELLYRFGALQENFFHHYFGDKYRSHQKMKRLIAILVLIVMLSGGVYVFMIKPGMDAKWCQENFQYLSNLTEANFRMIHHGDGFPISCCADSHQASYETDEGTLSRFIGGKYGYYMSENCEWDHENKYGAIKK